MAIELTRRRAVLALAAFQAADAVACAIPAPYIKADLDRLGCPPALQRALPVIKGASAVGLLAGLAVPPGRLTSAAVVGYFGAAIGFHIRAGDPAWRYAGAAGVGSLAAYTLLTA